jgi:pantetheine-phosphate adenylyltransferase
MRTAVYPGTFDPVTNGHLDVVKRAAHIFDKVIVAVALNARKKPLFSLDERVAFIEENIRPIPNATVSPFDGLTVDFAKSVGAVAVIRGLRAVSDFEYEFQMAQMNRQLDGDIETIFLMPNQEYFYTSSQLIKLVSGYTTERIKQFIPNNVREHLQALLDKNS